MFGGLGCICREDRRTESLRRQLTSIAGRMPSHHHHRTIHASPRSRQKHSTDHADDTAKDQHARMAAHKFNSELSHSVVSSSRRSSVETLKYGDVVIFFTDQSRRGLLRTEGLRDTSCHVDTMEMTHASPTNFRECLFRVQPRMKYVAHEELQEELQDPEIPEIPQIPEIDIETVPVFVQPVQSEEGNTITPA